MSTNTSDRRNNNGETTKIGVRVPITMINVTDEEFTRRGYTSRSEAIRDTPRDWPSPLIQLSEETFADLQESRTQRGADGTVSLDGALGGCDVGVDDDQA